MALSHEIKVDGVRAVLLALPKTIKNVFVVFTVPEDRVDNYKLPQKAPADEDLTFGTYKYTVQQFRLVFSNRDLLSIAVPYTAAL
ncbi:unnamed protein product [Tuber aestivum]|uniref:Uncharacterized protein n=1 Tax=Tuber aestivum TaxID=59557 RepID=A0A292PRC5_9PEZI|nr:unnamed protein product [Tuber aestivum]